MEKAAAKEEVSKLNEVLDQARYLVAHDESIQEKERQIEKLQQEVFELKKELKAVKKASSDEQYDQLLKQKYPTLRQCFYCH